MVERRTVVVKQYSCADILRSLVRIRLKGRFFFLVFFLFNASNKLFTSSTSFKLQPFAMLSQIIGTFPSSLTASSFKEKMQPNIIWQRVYDFLKDLVGFNFIFTVDEPKELEVCWGLVWDSVLEEEPHFQFLSKIQAWFTVQVLIDTYVMLFGCKFDAPFDHFLWQGNWHGKYKLVQFYWMLLLSLSSSLLIKIHCCVAYKFQHQAQWKFNTGHKIFYHYVCIILNNTTFHLIHI